MRYDLTGLGADGFEKLCLALAKSLHGPPVRLADDDRQDDSDAASEETPDSSEPVYAENRVGLLTLIAKYVSVSGYPEEDFRKLERAVKLELDALYELQLSGTNSDQLPHWILFATNITLTKNIGDGRETIDALINDYSGRLPLHGWIIWDADEISRHLDNHPDIRLTFVLEQDYISNLRPTSEFDSLTVFRLSSLGERPSECAEIVPSWWRLLATHDAVTGLFETLYSVRQKAVGHIDESEIGRSYERLQDLLRAAIVFTSAGIDSCLQSLLTHAIPLLATNDRNARAKFERYLESQAHAPKASSSFVAALKSPDPRSRLLELHILSLVSASFQGSSSIKDRGLAALGITNEQVPNSRIVSLDAFFIARNYVVHRLDLVQPYAPDARPASQPRNQEEVGRMCDEALVPLQIQSHGV